MKKNLVYDFTTLIYFYNIHVLVEGSTCTRVHNCSPRNIHFFTNNLTTNQSGEINELLMDYTYVFFFSLKFFFEKKLLVEHHVWSKTTLFRPGIDIKWLVFAKKVSFSDTHGALTFFLKNLREKKNMYV